jgi:thiamine-phosphate pyrophosphorylase
LSLSLHGLYAITDERLSPGPLLIQHAEQALRGGACILQYRNKLGTKELRHQQALELQALCRDHDATFIINDDVDLARRIRADGVHIGEDDKSLEQARDLLGTEAIIGVSCYDQLALAVEMRDRGADYLAFGRVFASSTKPSTTRAPLSLFEEARSLQLPVCAIGGINTGNAVAVVEAGADMLAVIHGLFAAEDIESTARCLASLFPSNSDV